MEKSGALDQALMEDIARHCPQQFLAFHKCMSNGGTGCDKEQFELAGCIKQQVPSFQKIQGECAAKLKEYESCLKGTEDCSSQLLELRKCATGTIEG
ncbi:uncharacterized protein CANTADRAFT_52186 [Suhomyces tanzawaensis NRRL Y-17324]|uniref:IMS import disulfide relay-system CHCH-CHCH-like Cx9C domain-containing protein n=1 Tax=Suhomyces tanzawaensis NRRL Y-17324 TaxID=984487 RepID=A0A1E4SHZ1_9ASCO|nr:uncharacterized protein CANTADRAFT_52186 [Suhomyces tanzawaensis NRRL Y-17324]ODV79134.1 hypothetical protein CANTADRAFT_52186 [Suhomyces tanzawaensis NRRL Y-17324]